MPVVAEEMYAIGVDQKNERSGDGALYIRQENVDSEARVVDTTNRRKSKQ